MGYLSWVGLTSKKIRSNHGSTHFCFGSKKSSLDQIFFGSGQKILTRIAMSSYATRSACCTNINLRKKKINHTLMKILHHLKKSIKEGKERRWRAIKATQYHHQLFN